MGVEHTVPAPTVASTVLAQLCGPKANETEMGATLFTKNGEGRTLTLNFSLTDLSWAMFKPFWNLYVAQVGFCHLAYR